MFLPHSHPSSGGAYLIISRAVQNGCWKRYDGMTVEICGNLWNIAYEFCLCLTLYEASYDTYCLTRSCSWWQTSGLLDRNRSHVEQR